MPSSLELPTETAALLISAAVKRRQEDQHGRVQRGAPDPHLDSVQRLGQEPVGYSGVQNKIQGKPANSQGTLQLYFPRPRHVQCKCICFLYVYLRNQL